MRKLKKCLAPVWDKITYYRRGSSYATLEVRFASGEEVKRNSDKTLKTKEVVLLPTYLGRRTSKVTVAEIPPEVEPDRIVDALCQDREDKLNLVQIIKIAAQKKEELLWKCFSKRPWRSWKVFLIDCTVTRGVPSL